MHHPEKKTMSVALQEAPARCATGDIFLFEVLQIRRNLQYERCLGTVYLRACRMCAQIRIRHHIG